MACDGFSALGCLRRFGLVVVPQREEAEPGGQIDGPHRTDRIFEADRWNQYEGARECADERASGVETIYR